MGFKFSTSRVTPTKTLLVLGDSGSNQNYALSESWVTHFENVLNQNGVKINVVNRSVNAHTMYRAMNTVSFGTKTAVQSGIDENPDIVLVMLGHNDTIPNTDERDQEEVMQDATDLFTQLRSSLPNAEIYYVSQVPYDTENFTTATLKNKGIAPQYMTLRENPDILEACWSPEILDDDVSAEMRTSHANWEELDTHTKALTQINDHFNVELFMETRLGGQVSDSLHGGSFAHYLRCSSIIEGLISVDAPFLSGLADQLIPDWGFLTNIFNNYLISDGDDGWIPNPALTAQEDVVNTNFGQKVKLINWFMPYAAASFTFVNKTPSNDGTGSSIFRWFIDNAPPNTEVFNSVNGGGFTTTGVFTDQNGHAEDMQSAGVLSLADDTYDFRFKCGTLIFDVTEVTLTTP